MESGKKLRRFLKNAGLTLLILAVCFLVSLFLDKHLDMGAHISLVFTLAVFVVAIVTDGYFYGIAAALVSVLAVNYAFTFPMFEFDFSVLENILSAVVMIVVTTVTSALVTIVKAQKDVKLVAEKEKMRANLLRAISHDLRTPLTSIYGSVSTVSENWDALSDGQKIEMLGGVKADAMWLIRMVENLLSVTRIEGDKSVELSKGSVVVEELVASVLEKFSKSRPSVRLKHSMPQDFIVVSADGMLIEQVLMNFLDNAAEHARGMTELSLDVSESEDKVVFEVKDNGCGISPERLETIFEGSGMSLKHSSDRKKHSMGIGLSVCSSVIKAHGGEIYARRRKQGGMVFGFTLDKEELSDE